jgi:hypothetical protein
MVVNCQRNKTELICFGKESPDVDSFGLGKNQILITDKTKVLGVILDKNLDFRDHSKLIRNRLLYKWVSMAKYSNRNWGMNQEVIVRILKTIMFSTLFYAGIVWMKEANTKDINGLIYKMTKSAIGAVFNISQVNTEIILGLPPFWIVNKINMIKHYLKLIYDQPEDYIDTLITYISNEVSTHQNSVIISQLKDVYKFLKWKSEHIPSQFSDQDMDILDGNNISKFHQISETSCRYTKSLMDSYTKELWQTSVNTRLQLEGETRFPNVTTSPMRFPRGTSREEEVKVLSFFYKNNLLNSFLYRVQQQTCPSPLCVCGLTEQTSHHVIADCTLVDEQRRMLISEILISSDNTSEDEISLLNCSRNPVFIGHCLQIVRANLQDFRTDIILR